MRALHLKHWRRGKTIYRELLKLGAKPQVAQSVAVNGRRWWRNSLSALHNVLTIAYFDRLGMSRLTCPQLPEPPGADPHAGWCGRGPATYAGHPYADHDDEGE